MPHPVDPIHNSISAAIFVLIDVSGSMAGKPLSDLQKELTWWIGQLRASPELAGSLRISAVTFGNSVDQVRAPVPLSSFSLPQLTAGGFSALGGALKQLDPLLDAEPRAAVLVLGDGQSTDDCSPALAKLAKNAFPVVFVCLKASVCAPPPRGPQYKSLKLQWRQDPREIFKWLLEVARALHAGALDKSRSEKQWPACPKQLVWQADSDDIVPEPSLPELSPPKSQTWGAWRETWEQVCVRANMLGLVPLPALESLWQSSAPSLNPEEQCRAWHSAAAMLDSIFQSPEYPARDIASVGASLAARLHQKCGELILATPLGRAYSRLKDSIDTQIQDSGGTGHPAKALEAGAALTEWHSEMTQLGAWFHPTGGTGSPPALRALERLEAIHTEVVRLDKMPGVGIGSELKRELEQFFIQIVQNWNTVKPIHPPGNLEDKIAFELSFGAKFLEGSPKYIAHKTRLGDLQKQLESVQKEAVPAPQASGLFSVPRNAPAGAAPEKKQPAASAAGTVLAQPTPSIAPAAPSSAAPNLTLMPAAPKRTTTLFGQNNPVPPAKPATNTPLEAKPAATPRAPGSGLFSKPKSAPPSAPPPAPPATRPIEALKSDTSAPPPPAKKVVGGLFSKSKKDGDK